MDSPKKYLPVPPQVIGPLFFSMVSSQGAGVPTQAGEVPTCVSMEGAILSQPARQAVPITGPDLPSLANTHDGGLRHNDLALPMPLLALRGRGAAAVKGLLRVL